MEAVGGRALASSIMECMVNVSPKETGCIPVPSIRSPLYARVLCPRASASESVTKENAATLVPAEEEAYRVEKQNAMGGIEQRGRESLRERKES
jgi:hypothetical protein